MLIFPPSSPVRLSMTKPLWACNSSTTPGRHIEFDVRLGWTVSRHKIFDKLFVPGLKNEQRPYLLMPGEPTALLQTDNFLNSLRIEVFCARRISAQQCIANQVTQ